MKRLLILALLAVLAPGCADIRGDLKTGKFTVNSRLTNRKFGVIEWRMGTTYFRVEGYESDQVQALKAGLDAGIAAAAKTIKPPP
jgi:hypothetical protein